MEEIVGDVFIQYKSGFIAGKEKIVEFTRLGVPLDLHKEEDGMSLWYRFGYEDATTYFSEALFEGKDILTIRVSSIIKDLFVNRVLLFNKETGREISMGSFHFW